MRRTVTLLLLCATAAIFLYAVTRNDTPSAPTGLAQAGLEGPAEEAVDTQAQPVSTAKESPTWESMLLNWPSFRGPGATGKAHFTNAPIAWDVETGTGIRWKTAVPLPGANSPVVWGDRLFLSGADEHVREVYCYDTETGALLWTKRLDAFDGTPAEAPRVTEETGYAAPTLAVHGDRVFAIFANADIVALDFGGKLLWGRNLGLPDNHYGHSSSLLAYEGLLYVQLDDSTEPKLVALDTASGAEVWVQVRESISWSSPILAHTAQGPQVILNNEEKVEAYDPATGRLIWSQVCLGGEVAPSPAYGNGIVFAANEYAVGSAIQLSGTADAVQTEILWEYDELLPEVSSPVSDGERFYFGTSAGDIVCLDALTGEELWAELADDRIYSSPVLVGDRIYILDMPGNMYIFRASAEYEQIAKIAMGEETVATPAFTDGRIYLRTAAQLYCIE